MPLMEIMEINVMNDTLHVIAGGGHINFQPVNQVNF